MVPARNICHPLESIHEEIFAKVQNRRVRRRRGRRAVRRLRLSQTCRRWLPIRPGKRIAGRRWAAAEQGKIDLEPVKAIAPLEDVKWSQLGGSINDASCLSKTEIYGVVEVHSVEDITKTLAFARDNKLPVTTAGVRHSMGGQAFRKGGIVLDMRGFNRIVLERERALGHRAAGRDLARHPERAASALCGARDAVDRHLHRRRIDLGQRPRHGPSGRRARQVDQVDAGDAGRRLAAHACRRPRTRELFNLVVGGYGLFGVILEAELDIADNLVYQTGRRVIDYKEFPALFRRRDRERQPISA